MTIQYKNIEFQFRLTEVKGNYFQASTRQNVQKRIESIIYTPSPADGSVKLAYIGSQELNPENNLYIGDRSNTLFANQKIESIEQIINDTVPTVSNINFIITRIFDSTNTNPLYFKHILSTDIIPESVRILDKDFNIIGNDRYKLQLEQEYDITTEQPVSPASYTEYSLYNNLENFYDISSGEYEVYFVQYTEIINGADITRTEILNNDLAYHQATWEDMSILNPNTIKSYARAYTLDGSTLNLSGTGKIAIKYEQSRQLKIHKPTATEDTRPWFLRINNAEINTQFYNSSLSYEIKEFSDQAFNPIAPYRLAARIKGNKLNSRLLKLQHDTIKSGSFYSSFYLLIEEDGIVKYAITDDEEKIDTYYRDLSGNLVLDEDNNEIVWSDSYLFGVDSYTGIVYLGIDILDSYDCYATYSYEETKYELTSLNMNPIFDINAQNEIRCVYIIPETSANQNLGIQTESVRWVRVSPSGKIVATNQDDSGNNENIDFDVMLSDSDGYNISGALGLYYNWKASTTCSSTKILSTGTSIPVSSTSTFPYSGWIRFIDTDGYYRYTKFSNKTDSSLILSSTASEIPSAIIDSGTTIELVNFIDERTTMSDRVITEEYDYVYGADAPVCMSRYFVLGEISINPPNNNYSFLDVRENGGGIIKEKYNEAKLINPEIQWISDNGNYDGQVYPSNAVIVFKFPVSILEEYTKEQIEDIVDDSIPYGVKPLIRFYGYKPNIVSTKQAGPLMSIVWDKMGSEFTYDVWLARNKNGPWIKCNKVRLTDDILDKAFNRMIGAGSYDTYSKNTYTIYGLSENTKYYIKVTCNDKYEYFWYSYSSAYSLEGGLSQPNVTPDPEWGNVLGFQINIT